MNTDAMLLMLVAMVALNLVVAFASWWRHDGLASRVTRIEERQAHALTAKECREIYEALAGIEGRLDVTNRLMNTIQEHLLEREK